MLGKMLQGEVYDTPLAKSPHLEQNDPNDPSPLHKEDRLYKNGMYSLRNQQEFLYNLQSELKRSRDPS